MFEKEKFSRVAVTLAVVAAMMFGFGYGLVPEANGAGQFEGVEITVFTQPRPFIAKPVESLERFTSRFYPSVSGATPSPGP